MTDVSSKEKNGTLLKKMIEGFSGGLSYVRA
jgi:hypothetical protein